MKNILMEKNKIKIWVWLNNRKVLRKNRLIISKVMKDNNLIHEWEKMIQKTNKILQVELENLTCKMKMKILSKGKKGKKMQEKREGLQTRTLINHL